MAYTQITSGAAYALMQDGFRAALPKWRVALANVFSGTADAKVLFIGDSTTAGVGPNTTPLVTGAATTKLTTLMNARYGAPAAQGLGLPTTVQAGNTDTRWTVGTGWTDIGGFGFAGSADYKATSSTTGTLTYTPSGGANYDSFHVYYLNSLGNGLGTFRAVATGGGNTDIDTGTNPDGIKRGTVTGTAGVSNTLQITHQAGGDVHIIGVEPFSSTTKRIRVANGGLGGTTTGEWNQSATFGSLQAIGVYAPDLTVVSLGINDAIGSVAAATVSTNLQAIIAAAQASGDVIIQTMFPSSDAGYNAFEAQYVTKMMALGVSLGLAVFDYWGVNLGVYPTALGAGDGVHPGALGYWDMASSMYPLLAL